VINLSGENINCVYLDLLKLALEDRSGLVDSRVGPVRDMGPALLEFTQPQHQLLFLRGRKYNPFFSLVESSWVLSGRNELSDLRAVISGYSKFSDDGDSLNGAYGFRMRRYFGIDQVSESISLLKKNSESRRAVISLYSAQDLVNNSSLDIPCNTTLFLKIRDGALDFTVINRSNDLFLGVPYNVFVFGVIQKFVANELGVQVGVQRHFTDSLHLYEENAVSVRDLLSVNSQKEIDSWVRKYPCNPELFNGIFYDAEAISKLDPKGVKSDYCRTLVDAFLRRKESGCSDSFESLASDAFGHAARLWLASL
jgi:thymidylate synthase